MILSFSVKVQRDTKVRNTEKQKQKQNSVQITDFVIFITINKLLSLSVTWFLLL